MATVIITEKDIDKMFVDALKWEPGQEKQGGGSAVLQALKDQAQKFRGNGSK